MRWLWLALAVGCSVEPVDITVDKVESPADLMEPDLAQLDLAPPDFSQSDLARSPDDLARADLARSPNDLAKSPDDLARADLAHRDFGSFDLSIPD